MRISDWSSDVCSSDLDAAGNAGHGQERLDLRGEDQPALVLKVVERLDAEPVAAQHQAPPRRIPDRKTENAEQPPDEGRAQALVEVNQPTGLAAGPEARPRCP